MIGNRKKPKKNTGASRIVSRPLPTCAKKKDINKDHSAWQSTNSLTATVICFKRWPRETVENISLQNPGPGYGRISICVWNHNSEIEKREGEKQKGERGRGKESAWRNLLGKAPVVAGEALLEGVLAALGPRLVPVLVDNTEDDVRINGHLRQQQQQH